MGDLIGDQNDSAAVANVFNTSSEQMQKKHFSNFAADFKFPMDFKQQQQQCSVKNNPSSERAMHPHQSAPLS